MENKIDAQRTKFLSLLAAYLNTIMESTNETVEMFQKSHFETLKALSLDELNELTSSLL